MDVSICDEVLGKILNYEGNIASNRPSGQSARDLADVYEKFQNFKLKTGRYAGNEEFNYYFSRLVLLILLLPAVYFILLHE